MGKKRWQVELDGVTHEVVLDHGYFSGRRRILVDGTEILDVRPDPLTALRLSDAATEHEFAVAGHRSSIQIRPGLVTYKKHLIVDGRDVETGANVEPLPMTSAGLREGRWLENYGGVAVQPFAVAAAVLGAAAAGASGQPLWIGAGLLGTAICWRLGRIFGENTLAKVLFSAAVVVVLLVALMISF